MERVVRYLLIMFLMFCSLGAEITTTRYNVDMSVLGNVGYADVTFTKNSDTYEIKLVAVTTGIAATLLKNRVETFISRGRIIEGRYLPDIFVKQKETTKKTKEEHYSFDHEKKEIYVREESKKFSTPLFSSNVKTKISKNEKKLDIYRQNDVLSSYLNTKRDCNTVEKFFKLTAIGAHDDKNDITVSRIEGETKNIVKHYFSSGVDEIYNLNVTPTKEKDDDIVDVLVAFDNDGLLKEAYLGEVFWVGKVTAKRVYHKISSN